MIGWMEMQCYFPTLARPATLSPLGTVLATSLTEKKLQDRTACGSP